MNDSESYWSTHYLQLRLAMTSDAVTVQQFISDVFAVYINQLGRIPRTMLADYHQIIQQGSTWLVERNHELIAVLVLVDNHDHYHITGLAVRADSRCQGIGTALMHHAEVVSLDAGYSHIWLHTNETMTANLRLYASLGYQEQYRQPYQGTSTVYMAKILA